MEEEINKIIHNSGSDIDSSDSDLEISGMIVLTTVTL